VVTSYSLILFYVTISFIALHNVTKTANISQEFLIRTAFLLVTVEYFEKWTVTELYGTLEKYTTDLKTAGKRCRSAVLST
jgi:hypothetical protein